MQGTIFKSAYNNHEVASHSQGAIYVKVTVQHPLDAHDASARISIRYRTDLGAEPCARRFVYSFGVGATSPISVAAGFEFRRRFRGRLDPTGLRFGKGRNGQRTGSIARICLL